MTSKTLLTLCSISLNHPETSFTYKNSCERAGERFAKSRWWRNEGEKNFLPLDGISNGSRHHHYRKSLTDLRWSVRIDACINLFPRTSEKVGSSLRGEKKKGRSVEKRRNSDELWTFPHTIYLAGSGKTKVFPKDYVKNNGKRLDGTTGYFRSLCTV